MSRMNKSKSGFTIVELLIVIVVIGVLAAITVVAYNGIQAKARNAQFLSAIDAYEKAVQMYMIAHDGKVPTVPSDQSGGTGVACLGKKYPATSDLGAGVCTASYPDARISPQVNAALEESLSVLPDTSDIMFRRNGVLFQRGLIYWGDNNAPLSSGLYGPHAQLSYTIDDDQNCGRGGWAKVVIDGKTITQCIVDIR